MSTISKILLALFVILVAISASATYYKYVVLQDFEVEFEVDCDSTVESCFTWICDPEIDGEDYCTGDPEDDVWDYKLFYRNAMNVPQCDPEEDEDCLYFECTEEEIEEDTCYELTCTQELAEEYGYEECTFTPEDETEQEEEEVVDDEMLLEEIIPADEAEIILENEVILEETTE